jgi:cephalosporin-C deacetylase-like acetyl esterase
MKFNRSMFSKAGIVATLALLQAQAHAAPITLPVELTDALASVAVIGAGVFAIAVGVKLYKWIKGAL